MRRVGLLSAVIALLACAAAGSAAAATFPGATPVVGGDGALLAVAANTKDAHGSLDAVIGGVEWGVTGTISVYVPGQTVSVAVYRDGVLATTQTVPVEAAASGSGGQFAASFVIHGKGDLTVQATHALTPQQELLVSDPVYLTLARSYVRAGARSLAARVLQVELAADHYVVGRPGVYDARTQRAVLAFRKLADMPRTMVADRAVFRALAAGRGRFKVRYPHQGRHAEGDLTHQVLALIGPHGKVERLYPMSSGKPSTPTQPGLFRVWLREPGVNNDDMVDSSFFNGGDAIHGYNPVPPYPASHGCLRVPVPDALSIYDWIGGTGVPVDVYYR
jgi:hypothetical protein